MIPDYCYDCMNRQMPMTQTPAAPSTMYGMPQQMPMQGGPQMQMPMQGMPQMQMPMQGMPQMQMPPMMPGVPGQPGGLPAPPVDFGPEPAPGVITDIGYTQGWLRTQIGQRVKIEFLIGTNMLIDREGTLLDVGISYIIIREVDTDDLLMCDIYSIKFVRIYL